MHWRAICQAPIAIGLTCTWSEAAATVGSGDIGGGPSTGAWGLGPLPCAIRAPARVGGVGETDPANKCGNTSACWHPSIPSSCAACCTSRVLRRCQSQSQSTERLAFAAAVPRHTTTTPPSPQHGTQAAALATGCCCRSFAAMALLTSTHFWSVAAGLPARCASRAIAIPSWGLDATWQAASA